MWKYTVERGRPQMAIWRRTRTACWTNKATHKHSEHVILIAFPLQKWMQERSVMLRYTCPACHVYCDVSSCRLFAAVRTPAREEAQRTRQNAVHTASNVTHLHKHKHNASWPSNVVITVTKTIRIAAVWWLKSLIDFHLNEVKLNLKGNWISEMRFSLTPRYISTKSSQNSRLWFVSSIC